MLENNLGINRSGVINGHREGSIDEGWVFQNVVANTIPPDKDGIEEALEHIRDFYRNIGVNGRDRARLMSNFEGDFYGGDRVGQMRAADRISGVHREMIAGRVRLKGF